MWEMFSYGEQPYGTKTGAEVMQFLESNSRLEQPKKCPDNIYSIMKKCWNFETEQRPTFRELATNIFPSRKGEYVNTEGIVPASKDTVV